MNGDANQSPQSITDYIYTWLENALDCGITEWDFWDMTLAELERAVASKRRIQKVEAKEKASFDYILADLVGRSVARIYSSSNKMPDIKEIYSSLFDEEDEKVIEEKRQERQAELSALRFKQFADAYNKKHYGGGKKD